MKIRIRRRRRILAWIGGLVFASLLGLPLAACSVEDHDGDDDFDDLADEVGDAAEEAGEEIEEAVEDAGDDGP